MLIRWDELGPQSYEDMVSVLVSRLHPDAQRIDGKGGDGGRDVQIVRGQDNRLTDALRAHRRLGASPLKRMADQQPSSICRTIVEWQRPLWKVDLDA